MVVFNCNCRGGSRIGDEPDARERQVMKSVTEWKEHLTVTSSAEET